MWIDGLIHFGKFLAPPVKHGLCPPCVLPSSVSPSPQLPSRSPPLPATVFTWAIFSRLVLWFPNPVFCAPSPWALPYRWPIFRNVRRRCVPTLLTFSVTESVSSAVCSAVFNTRLPVAPISEQAWVRLHVLFLSSLCDFCRMLAIVMATGSTRFPPAHRAARGPAGPCWARLHRARRSPRSPGRAHRVPSRHSPVVSPGPLLLHRGAGQEPRGFVWRRMEGTGRVLNPRAPRAPEARAEVCVGSGDPRGRRPQRGAGPPLPRKKHAGRGVFLSFIKKNHLGARREEGTPFTASGTQVPEGIPGAETWGAGGRQGLRPPGVRAQRSLVGQRRQDHGCGGRRGVASARQTGWGLCAPLQGPAGASRGWALGGPAGPRGAEPPHQSHSPGLRPGARGPGSRWPERPQ